MLDLIKGCRFDGWMELEQGYSIAGEWLTANVDARRIRTVFDKFADYKEGHELCLWIEEPSGLDAEKNVQNATADSMGVVENIHFDVYYLEGLNGALVKQILDFSGELLINDGISYCGLLSDDGDEIGKYQCNIVRARSGKGDLRGLRSLMEENKIPYREDLLTAWDLSSDDRPVISSRYTIGGQTVQDTIRILEGMGLYKAEVRETNSSEE